VVVAVGLAKSVESISDIAYGFQQHREEMDRIAKSMMLRGSVALGFLGFGVYATGSVLAGCLGVVVGWTVVLFAYDLRASGASMHDVIATRVTSPAVSDLALAAAPLGVVMMLSSLNVNIPRYVIQYYAGERSLGLFAAVAYTMVAGTTVVGALGQSASPRLAHYYVEGRIAQFRTLMWKLMGVGALLGFAGVMAAVTSGRLILRVLFRPEYAASTPLLTWTMAAAAVSYQAAFMGYGLTAARRFAVQAPLFTVVCGTVGVSALVLVPRFGAIGGAWAIAAGAIVQLAASAAILAHALRQPPAEDPE
jgi:O-antigen/teichoic acid export membrane protein